MEGDGEQGGAAGRAGHALGHGHSSAFRQQIDGFVDIPVGLRRGAVEQQPVPFRIVAQRNGSAGPGQLQLAGRRQRLDLRQRTPHAGSDRRQGDAVEPFLLDPDFQHRRGTRRPDYRARHRRPDDGRGGSRRRRRLGEDYRMHAEIPLFAGEFLLFQAVGARDAGFHRRIRPSIGGTVLLEGRRQQGAVQPDLDPAFRIDTVDEEAGRIEFRGCAPGQAAFPTNPFAPHLRQLGPRGIPRGNAQVNGQIRLARLQGDGHGPDIPANIAAEAVAVHIIVVANLGGAENAVGTDGSEIKAHDVGLGQNHIEPIHPVGIRGGLGHEVSIGIQHGD